MKKQIQITPEPKRKVKEFTGLQIKQNNGVYKCISGGYDHIRYLSIDGVVFIVGDLDPFYKTGLAREIEIFVKTDEKITVTFSNED